MVIKKGDVLYHTEIDPEMNIISKKHLCTNCDKVSAAPDPEGCQKVRDRLKLKQIEKYRFLNGYETFATNDHDQFVVYECQHHKEFPDRPGADKWNPKEKVYGHFTF